MICSLRYLAQGARGRLSERAIVQRPSDLWTQKDNEGTRRLKTMTDILKYT